MAGNKPNSTVEPDSVEETETANVDAAKEVDDTARGAAALAEDRDDSDDREANIRPHRKPMGPPLQDEGNRIVRNAEVEQDTDQPTDPETPGNGEDK